MIKILKYLRLYFLYLTKLDNNTGNIGVEGIVFSMDRPLQLYSLLESYYKYCDVPAKLNILVKSSNDLINDEYLKIQSNFKNYDIKFYQENCFKSDLQKIINNVKTTHIFFLVDDIIFIRKFCFNKYFLIRNYNNYIFSLRLGRNLNYCYPRSKKQILPTLINKQKFYSWNWFTNLKNGDWGYVFSVDGNIYSKNQIIKMSSIIDYKGPNSFESNMNIFKFIFMLKKGLCCDKSILVNVSLGRVNKEIENISGLLSMESLFLSWCKGFKIDINYFNKIDNKSAHIEVENVALIKRESF